MRTYTESDVAEIVALAMIEHGVAPGESFTADAGADYGLVEAWELPSGDYAIKYGNNAETGYYLADNADDLAAWLIHDNLFDGAELVEMANVRGLASLPEAEGDNLGRGFAIMISRDYYGPTTEHDLARDEHGRPLTWGNLADAQEAAEEMDEGVYVTAHNESGRPTYTVVPL